MKPLFSDKEKKPKVSLSVRELCAFVLRQGDIKRNSGYAEMMNGTAIHRMLQQQCLSKDERYKAEVRLGVSLDCGEYILEVGGRADGITCDGCEYTVDEIKSVIYPLSLIDENFSRLHLAQAKCYAYILAKNKMLDLVNVKLIYYHLEDNEIRTFSYSYEFSQLSEFFYSLVQAYGKWALLALEMHTRRTQGVEKLKFPFKKARAGQSDLMKECYTAITHNYNLYVNAPTGIGKTISTIYPATLSFNKNTDKIFYLTAKTSTQNVAEQAISLVCGDKPFVKSVTISAKGKMCICPGVSEHDYPCESCERGINYYQRVNDAVFDIITNEWIITTDKIRAYAEKHKVCPFEYSLDISEWCDMMIGDYNYIFDPRVAIKRYDDTGEKYVYLVDEAHNLADRAREMFSAQVKLGWFERFNGVFKDSFPELEKLLLRVEMIIKSIISDAKESSQYISFDMPEALYLAVNRLEITLSEALKKEREIFAELDKKELNALISLMMDCRHFANIASSYDKNYISYIDQGDQIMLYCVQPGTRIKKAIETGSTAVFFSATLLPWEYYLTMLGYQDSDISYEMDSPFLQDNFLVMSYGLSTKYADREANAIEIARAIKASISVKTGNYIAFFPSFSYMEKVKQIYSMLYPDSMVLMQKRKMSSLERENFIAQFTETPKTTLVGFAVMGGVFSEGIDLAGDRLCGVIIVGTGLPAPCIERSAVSEYFTENDQSGFNYSFFFPGMNRVFQAMGRVIRTENDRGFALLIDERFLHEESRETFPPYWQDIKTVVSPKDIYRNIKEFFE